jgi:putative ABC transport system ATP-binding protein
MTAPILKIENLTRALTVDSTQKKIINNISYDFYSQRIYNIIGPSGAGKSSLLRLLNRLDEPTGGEILFKDKKQKDYSPCNLRRKIGYLFQAPYLFDDSVRDNLLYAEKSLNEDELFLLLEKVHLSKSLIDSPVARLSGGEKQRVALARLLATEPEIMLLDEPTSSLDPSVTQAVEKLIIEIVEQEKLTALVVTHNPDQAIRIGGEALLLVDGNLIESGYVDELINNPKTELGQKYKARELR